MRSIHFLSLTELSPRRANTVALLSLFKACNNLFSTTFVCISDPSSLLSSDSQTILLGRSRIFRYLRLLKYFLVCNSSILITRDWWLYPFLFFWLLKNKKSRLVINLHHDIFSSSKQFAFYSRLFYFLIRILPSFIIDRLYIFAVSRSLLRIY